MKKTARKIIENAVGDLEHITRNNGELYILWRRVPHNALTSCEANTIDGVLKHVRDQLQKLLHEV
jgi:hypothetical protein